MRFCTSLAVLLLVAVSPDRPVRATLVADLSDHLIAITTAFSGTEVLAFGAVEGEGDVVVVVHGPPRDEVVRRKDRIAGIWMNADSIRYSDVPGYYAVAASRALDLIAVPSTLRLHGIGLENLKLDAAPDERRSEADVALFREALIRRKQALDLYVSEVGRITFLGNRLFRTRLAFPANVPPGSYDVQAFQFREGQVVGAQRSVLVIGKIGVEADLYDFAHQRSAFYGVAAILVAIGSGWIAGVVFRRS